MLEMSQSEVLLSTLGLLLLAIMVGMMVMRRRQRLVLEAKERRILQARRRDIQKWEALQQRNRPAESTQEHGGDQP